MYILNIAKAMKKMTLEELEDVLSENYYQRIG